MAQKRMFDKRVVGSDSFMDLPMSAKALYFISGMEADDKGFFQPRKIQRTYGFSEDDFKVLIAKQYFIVFETGVMVITDWNKNNWLDSRRTQETEYVNELKLLELVNEKYEYFGGAKQMLSQNRIEENRREEKSIEEYTKKPVVNFEKTSGYEILSYIESNFGITINGTHLLKIEELLKTYNDEILCYAIDKCIENNAKTLNYFYKVIENWKQCNFKTIEEVKIGRRIF